VLTADTAAAACVTAHHTTTPQLVLRAINSAHSAFLAVSLSAQFFESYNVFSQRGLVQAGITIKVRARARCICACARGCADSLRRTPACSLVLTASPQHRTITLCVRPPACAACAGHVPLAARQLHVV
jgi:hypothetical protein